MKRTNSTMRTVVGTSLVFMFMLGALLVAPVPVLAQGPDAPPLPDIPPVEAPGGLELLDELPESGEPVPDLAQYNGDCHIGNPRCTPAGSYDFAPIPDPNTVRIAHGRPDGSTYYVGEIIYIYLYHSTGGPILVYDWYPYMGNEPRLLWYFWLPAGRPVVIRARMAPPTGEEWLTVYDPSSRAYDRTYWYVASWWPWPWP
jgi:hypothetical protein